MNPSLIIFKRTGLILIAVAMSCIGVSAWLGLHRSLAVEPEAAFDTAVFWQPWGGPAWIPAISRSLYDTQEPDQRAAMLRTLGPSYPLASTLWLEWARVAHDREASPESVAATLRLATAVDPGDAELRWRVAMIALQAGALDASADFLREFIDLRPREVDRAVLVARRWLTEPGPLLDTLLTDNPEAMALLLRHASNWQDWPLAAAVWQRMPHSMKTGADTAGYYVDRLLLAGRGGEAAEAWGRINPSFEPEAVSNGDFSDPLEQRSYFDWRLSDTEGVVISRDEEDFGDDPPGLRVHFDGSENVNLVWPQQYVTVEPGRTYRLSGRWKAVRLTTLSLPYWVVTGFGQEERSGLARNEAAGRGDWFWQGFALEFTVPEDMDVIRVDLRRSRTQNFDRFIAGDLWIDDVSLERVERDVLAGSE